MFFFSNCVTNNTTREMYKHTDEQQSVFARLHGGREPQRVAWEPAASVQPGRTAAGWLPSGAVEGWTTPSRVGSHPVLAPQQRSAQLIRDKKMGWRRVKGRGGGGGGGGKGGGGEGTCRCGRALSSPSPIVTINHESILAQEYICTLYSQKNCSPCLNKINRNTGIFQ
jgi:hypothetical protein